MYSLIIAMTDVTELTSAFLYKVIHDMHSTSI